MRFFFYSHDGLGLGHARRQLAIAAALVKLVPGAKVLLATGVEEISQLGVPPDVDTLKLPGLRKLANDKYGARKLGLHPKEIHRLRSALLLAAVDAFRPQVILVDKHPFGAGGELREALYAAKTAGSSLVLGLRDILDDPMTVRREWFSGGVGEEIARIFSQILIYGEKSVFDPLEEYQMPPALAQMARFCGYVVNESAAGQPYEWATIPDGNAARGPVVLATVGGGEDGSPVLREFIAAAGKTNWRAIALTGPLLPGAEARELQSSALKNRVVLRKFMPSLPQVFDSIDVLVTMGGYNTLAEAVFKGVPTVCVPRVTPRAEQYMRASRFQDLGLLRTIHPRDLTRERLVSEIEIALQTPRPEIFALAHQIVSFDGAKRAAQHLVSWALSDRASVAHLPTTAPTLPMRPAPAFRTTF